MVGDMNLMSDEEIEFFMTWFPKKADYEIEIEVLPDETLAEKIQRSEFSMCQKDITVRFLLKTHGQRYTLHK